MVLTSVRGGDSLGKDAVSDGGKHAEGERQWNCNDAVVPHGPHQGLRNRTQETTDQEESTSGDFVVRNNLEERHESNLRLR